MSSKKMSVFTLKESLDGSEYLIGVDGRNIRISARTFALFLAPYVPNASASGFIPVTGTVLPNPTGVSAAFTLVGVNTFTQTTGGNLVTVQPLNILGWNGSTWSLLVAIPLDLANYYTKPQVDSKLNFIEDLGYNAYTGANTGSSDITACYYNQAKTVARGGILTSFTAWIIINGGFTTRVVNLIQLRKNTTLNKYVEVSRNAITVVSGVQTIDVSSLNITTQKDDAFGIQLTQGNTFLQSVPQTGAGSAQCAMVGGIFEAAVSTVTGNPMVGNNRAFSFDFFNTSTNFDFAFKRITDLEAKTPLIAYRAANILNPTGVVPGQYINGSSNYVINTGSGYTASGFIPVVAGSTYKLLGFPPSGGLKNLQFSDANKTIVATTPGIALSSSIYADGEFTVTIPAGVSFIFFTIKVPAEAEYDYSTIKVYPTTGKSFAASANSLPFMAGAVDPGATMGGKQLKEALDVPLISILYNNQFSYLGVEDGKYINASSGYVFNTGAGFAGSGYVAVTPGSVIKLSGVVPIGNYKGMQFSDANKVIVPASQGVILNAGIYANGEFTVTIPAGVFFVYFTARIPTSLGEAAVVDYSQMILRTVGAAEFIDKINGKEIIVSKVKTGATMGGKQLATVEDPKAAVTVEAPTRIFTVMNDLAVQNSNTVNRNYASVLYIDHLFDLQSTRRAIKVKQTGSDKVIFFSPMDENGTPVNGGVNVLKTTRAITLSESAAPDVTFNVQHVSTKASVGESAMVIFHQIGDSNTFGPDSTRLNVPVTAPWKGYEFAKMLFEMDKIDAGNPAGKHNMLLSGASNYREFSFTYKTATINSRSFAEGNNAWGTKHYLYYTDLREASQGVWDLLGLGNGSGTDYTGTTAQKTTIYTTAEGKNTPTNTAAFITYMNGLYGSITNYAQALAKANDLLDNPKNKYFDKTKAGNNRFSFAKYLERYKTIADDGVTRLVVGSTAGTKVTSNMSYDLATPTHVLIQLGTNDALYMTDVEFLAAINVMIESIRAVNASIIIGFHMADSTGTYFPELYPEFDSLSTLNNFYHTAAIANNKQLRTLDSDANKLFYVPLFFIQPTAYGTPVRNVPFGESMGQNITSEKLKFYVRHSNAPFLHLSNAANAAYGYQLYSWIKYTLSL